LNPCFLTAVITIFKEGIVGLTILLAIPVIFFGFYYEQHKVIPVYDSQKNQSATDSE